MLRSLLSEHTVHSSLNFKLFLTLMMLSLSAFTYADDRKQLFDRGWKFYLGAAEEAKSFEFDDSQWRSVDLPHDWSIEPIKNQVPGKTIGPFSKESPGGAATGQTLGGEGWYRKSFTIGSADAGKRHELYFEGIYNQSEIWINGKKAGENMYGYSTFRFDITPYCNAPGEKNVIAIKVVNKGKNSRWYAGSGIYRHVYLIKTGQSHIDDWLSSVQTTSIQKDEARLSIATTVIQSKGDKDLSIDAVLTSPEGKVVGKEQRSVPSAANDTAALAFDFMVSNPKLWNVTTPSLYSLKLTLTNKKGVQDIVTLPFGIRTIAFSVDKGFQINGETLNLKGGCIHHDNGLLGAAAYDRAEERKIELLKANGFIAIRSHNPMSESFMQACDRLGMLVINEAFDQWERKKNPDDYHQYFKEWSAKDIKALVLRDRNKPSVIMWSIGNEIYERLTERGMEIAAYLRKEVLKYDTTRAITAGVNNQWDKERKNRVPIDNAFRSLDVAGYNYMWSVYERDHVRFPDRIMLGTESVATEAAANWDKVERLPYVIGDFIWTAMDYLGESGLGSSIEVDPTENTHFFQDWPWYNAWCGDIDLLGIKKPQSYYRDIVWKRRNITMAVELPAQPGKIRKVSFWGWPQESLEWNFPEQIGKEVSVNVYSRAPIVKLFLNGKFLAEQKTDSVYKATFKTPYHPGTLKAVEYIDGVAGDSIALTTPGEKRMLRLSADLKKLAADGQSLSHVLIELVDQHGQVVLESGRMIDISLSGKAGKIVASGNAAPSDMESFNSLQPKLFNGRAIVILRSGYEKGSVSLKVKSEGLKSRSLKISVK
ncbi:beta-galactosidase [Arcticibacter pallidicorallinus]|uniref:Beta-galactosidase n=1 Tax=Arcticibacter pallidicorallinus TaxID=1259464 RepID=A0A2T0U5K2_9SPHI|nr:sugar-binding domain-containing protein [Arcticibacter pallidicorallinus]PRY53203.1 beta-galactosidase [Arcticibacter pallidicorallinus]